VCVVPPVHAGPGTQAPPSPVVVDPEEPEEAASCTPVPASCDPVVDPDVPPSREPVVDPDVPLAPDFPEAPDVPEAPDSPEVPVEPVVPAAPVVPVAPVLPDEPLFVPVAPEVPPYVPELPVPAPEEPELPDVPVLPPEPEAPALPLESSDDEEHAASATTVAPSQRRKRDFIRVSFFREDRTEWTAERSNGDPPNESCLVNDPRGHASNRIGANETVREAPSRNRPSEYVLPTPRPDANAFVRANAAFRLPALFLLWMIHSRSRLASLAGQRVTESPTSGWREKSLSRHLRVGSSPLESRACAARGTRQLKNFGYDAPRSRPPGASRTCQ